MSESDDIHDLAKRLGIRIPVDAPAERTSHRPGPTQGRRAGGAASVGYRAAPELPIGTPAGTLQARLAAHFAELSAARASGQAVFALEHGLSDRELEDVEAFVKTEATVRTGQRHWLLWIVHAAELGYDFDGDYWPRFSRDTPGWDDSNDSRGWIREIFRWFADKFRGPQPTGAWGATFTIIAWPITNALLPKDLQRHLARALYEVQSGLVQHLNSASDLGHYIASNCWIRSDRFEQLIDQPVLLGQIAMALLQPDTVGEETILRTTLDRVAADLEQERQAATWLRSARVTVEQSQVRGGGRPFNRTGPLIAQERLDVAARATAPQLILVPRATDEWRVRLRLPFLAPLLEVSPEVRAQVASSRASVPAAPRSRLATGQLLYPDQAVDLEIWPTEGKSLLQFEGVSRGLEAALLSHWAMPPGPWLFAIRRNGVASEIRSRRIRPNRSYLLAVREADAEVFSKLSLIPLKAECNGVLVARIDAPDHLDRGWINALIREGLSPVREVTVWPAGVLSAEWDGEATIRWLSQDYPMLGVRADHAIQNLLISVDERPPEQLGNIDDGDTRFVSLDRTELGEHQVAVSYELDDELVIGMFSIQLSEPRLNPEESTGPVVIWTEPYTRNLERLWDGQSVVRADGVDVAGVTCTLTLRSGLSDPLERTIRGVRLPLTADAWRRLLRDSIQAEKGIQAKYPESRWATVALDVGDLGTYSLEFERELPPVRWILEETREGHRLELRSDMEANLPREILYATYDHPDVRVAVPFDGDPVRLKLEASGGLYVARVGDRGAMVLIPPLVRRLESFDALSVTPRLSPRPREAAALCELVETTRLWSSGHLPGDVRAQVWRTQIVRTLQADLFSLLCGREWHSGEDALQRDHSAEAFLRLQRMVVRSPGDHQTIAGALVGRAPEFQVMPSNERVDWFSGLVRREVQQGSRRWQSLIQRHGESTTVWFSEFCLRAASDSHLDTWAVGDLEDAISLLLERPLLARTARCLVMASLVGSPEADYPPLFPNWEWSLV